MTKPTITLADMAKFVPRVQQKRVALVVRMSPELREWFQQQASSNCRSLNGGIVFRLEAIRGAAVDGVVS